MIAPGLFLALAIVCCDGGCGTPVTANVEPTPEAVVVVETVAETPKYEEPTTQAYIPQPPVSEGFVAYSLYGIVPPVEWQRYLYNELCSRGYGWYMPYAMCQIFQESRWNQWSDNGRDFGLTQQKGIYWASRAAQYGIAGADIWDPYAQLHVFSCMMCAYLAYYNGDVGMALSAYYLGAWEYSDIYVNNVMEHWNALEVGE